MTRRSVSTRSPRWPPATASTARGSTSARIPVPTSTPRSTSSTAAPRSTAIPLETLVGPCHVVDATAVAGQLDAVALAGLELPPGAERLLFKTRNGALWERDTFSPDFAAFTGDGAEALVALAVRLAGIDYLSIGDVDAHHVLLGAGVVPLEGLDLRAVEPGAYTLVCLPLKLVEAEGAPARALLIRE